MFLIYKNGIYAVYSKITFFFEDNPDVNVLVQRGKNREGESICAYWKGRKKVRKE